MILGSRCFVPGNVIKKSQEPIAKILGINIDIPDFLKTTYYKLSVDLLKLVWKVINCSWETFVNVIQTSLQVNGDMVSIGGGGGIHAML